MKSVKKTKPLAQLKEASEKTSNRTSKSFKQRRGGGSRQLENNNSRIVYNGPVTIPASLEERRLFPMNFTFVSNLTTDGAGTLPQTFQTEDVRNAADWSSVAATFDEYRVVAMKVLWVPIKEYSNTFRYQPVATVVDRADATALSSYNIAGACESFQLHEGDRKFSRTMKMASVEEAEFLSVLATPTSWGWIKMYATNIIPVSTTIYRFAVTFLVQFRGRA